MSDLWCQRTLSMDDGIINSLMRMRTHIKIIMEKSMKVYWSGLNFHGISLRDHLFYAEFLYSQNPLKTSGLS